MPAAKCDVPAIHLRTSPASLEASTPHALPCLGHKSLRPPPSHRPSLVLERGLRAPFGGSLPSLSEEVAVALLSRVRSGPPPVGQRPTGPATTTAHV